MFGYSDTVTGAMIGAIFGFGGLVIGLIVNSIFEKRKSEQERLKDIRLRLLGNRLLASEVTNFVKSQRRGRLRVFALLSQYLIGLENKIFELTERYDVSIEFRKKDYQVPLRLGRDAIFRIHRTFSKIF